MAKGPGVPTTFRIIALSDQHSHYIEETWSMQPFFENLLIAHLHIIRTIAAECKGKKNFFMYFADLISG
jgi:hypothetical protein